MNNFALCEYGVYLHSKLEKMKTLMKLFTSNPSYTKWGNSRLATKTGLKESTIKRYKNTAEFKSLKQVYLNNCK